MNISNQNAMQIVKEISNIINQQINIIDSNGIILASTDSERIGTFHEGAVKVIEENLNELIIYEDDDYYGTKKGINLPIIIEGAIIGVVGITGEKDEVVNYGQIIKKMTEILLMEIYYKYKKETDSKILNRFIDEWLSASNINENKQLIQRGKYLGIDILSPKRILVIEIQDLYKFTDDLDSQREIDNVNTIIKNFIEKELYGVFCKTFSQTICILNKCEDDVVYDIASTIHTKVFASLGLNICIGIDSCQSNNINKSYLQAQKSLKMSKSSNKNYINFYSDLKFELLLDEISLSTKGEFIQKIFKDFSFDEISSWSNLLEVYYTNNGSLSKTAQQLYIHSNTLQYKLKKLSEQTGYDPRDLSDSSLYQLAVCFYNENKDKLNLL